MMQRHIEREVTPAVAGKRPPQDVGALETMLAERSR